MIKNKRRSILIPATKEHMHLVEAFVEKICDDYNIFDSYFGVILFSITETFSAFVANNTDRKEDILLAFRSLQKGLAFQFFPDNSLLELASLLQEKNIEPLTRDDNEASCNLQIVNMLSDEIHVDHEKGMLEIVFNLVSINHQLALERAKELDLYFDSIQETKKV